MKSKKGISMHQSMLPVIVLSFCMLTGLSLLYLPKEVISPVGVYISYTGGFICYSILKAANLIIEALEE